MSDDTTTTGWYARKLWPIKAVQYRGNNVEEVQKAHDWEVNVTDEVLWVRPCAHEEWVKLPVGWWIVREGDTWWLLPDDEFHATYERLADDASRHD